MSADNNFPLKGLSEDQMQELLNRVTMIRKADMIHSAVTYLNQYVNTKENEILAAILDDIDFGYSADMIKGKIESKSYFNS